MQDLAEHSIWIEITGSSFDGGGGSDKKTAGECRVALDRYSKAAEGGEKCCLVAAIYNAVDALVDRWQDVVVGFG
jgi:hypothetical protein